MNFGVPMVEPMAAYNLGHLLEERKDWVGARRVYERPSQFERTAAGVKALYQLGFLLQGAAGHGGWPQGL
jgi:hypothetical protein